MDNNTIWNDGKNKIYINPSELYDGYKYYSINVKSNVFIGENDFCISLDEIESIIKTDIVDLKVDDSIIITDYDSDSFIKFTVLDTLGKITVNGFIGGSHRENNMNFGFIADQTILQNLIRLFKSN